MRSERNDREQLEQELRGSAYQALLHRLQGVYPLFRRFRTWADVIAFMRDGTSTDPRKDEILRPISRPTPKMEIRAGARFSW